MGETNGICRRATALLSLRHHYVGTTRNTITSKQHAGVVVIFVEVMCKHYAQRSLRHEKEGWPKVESKSGLAKKMDAPRA